MITDVITSHAVCIKCNDNPSEIAVETLKKKKRKGKVRGMPEPACQIGWFFTQPGGFGWFTVNLFIVLTLYIYTYTYRQFVCVCVVI